MTQDASQKEVSYFRESFDQVVSAIAQIVQGKDDKIELALLCLFAEGHLLLEDVPGVGKTLLARCIAQALDADSKRIQCTPDLLPSDITGTAVYDPQAREFEFHEGPVFANVVIADELNRTSPKTQAALLEVMEERRITVDRWTKKPPEPFFFVVATQNPTDHESTYELPEAQLDRFLFKLNMGYPDAASELAILRRRRLGVELDRLPALISKDDYKAMTDISRRVYVHDEVDIHIVELLEHTRFHMKGIVDRGASPRAGVALLRAAQVRAASKGRPMVVPDDVRGLASAVLSHRLVLDPRAQLAGTTAELAVERLLAEVPPPISAVRLG